MSGEATAIFDDFTPPVYGDLDAARRAHLEVCLTCGNVHYNRVDCPVCRLVNVLDPLGAFEYLDEDWENR